ncbi:MAG: NADH-quinone oxidoreductase subunit NuoG [Pseudomonadota bacterium]|nr:NADH-quinone oxidoreductase subunit NuoG [Pseudomonadota bacterium]
MSAQPSNNVAPDLLNIEVDGKPTQIRKGAMIIEAADAIGVAIPRFCYHRKLPIAANCRMCLVDVEMGGKMMPKPQPACATPVAEGMKVTTRSEKALKFQKDVMEFLLINHPLDCPICDQGGECELQDVALGYGRSVSRYTERKRTVSDENLGPLVATEMTRCIQCTRCVRFTSEIAGTYELGGMSRGENLQIGTYIGKTVETELSGNIIDVCPVGALTNKPFRFKARAWELIAKPSIGYHDALGSNLWLHTRRGEVLRSVPRGNEAINECWLSDRDRYSHEGLYAQDRALKPMIRKNGDLVEVEWQDAIAFVADGLKKAGSDIGALIAPLASCEEGHLLAALLRGLGSEAIDHRLRVQDFADGGPDGTAFALPAAQLERVDAALLIGCDLRQEVPLLNHRLRQATRRGAKIYAINPAHFDFNYPLAGEVAVAPQYLVEVLLRMAKVAGDVLGDVSDRDLAEAIASAKDDEDVRAWFAALRDASSKVLVFGHAAAQHPRAAQLRALSKLIARAAGCAFNEIPDGANAIGLARVGVQPTSGGRNAAAMLSTPPKNLIVWHAGSQDAFSPSLFDKARTDAVFCVYIGAYACNGVRRTAHAVLPIGLPPEIDGTYVNLDGVVQQVAAGARLPGDARPGWKVLRALGGALGLSGFDFTELSESRASLPMQGAAREQDARTLLGQAQTQPDWKRKPLGTPAPDVNAPQNSNQDRKLVRLATVPIYRSDAILRRAPALQAHPLNRPPALRVCADDAAMLGLIDGGKADVNGASLAVVVDAAVPRGCTWIEGGFGATKSLPPYGAALTITKAKTT